IYGNLFSIYNCRIADKIPNSFEGSIRSFISGDGNASIRDCNFALWLFIHSSHNLYRIGISYTRRFLPNLQILRDRNRKRTNDHSLYQTYLNSFYRSNVQLSIAKVGLSYFSGQIENIKKIKTI